MLVGVFDHFRIRPLTAYFLLNSLIFYKKHLNNIEAFDQSWRITLRSTFPPIVLYTSKPLQNWSCSASGRRLKISFALYSRSGNLILAI